MFWLKRIVLEQIIVEDLTVYQHQEVMSAEWLVHPVGITEFNFESRKMVNTFLSLIVLYFVFSIMVIFDHLQKPE